MTLMKKSDNLLKRLADGMGMTSLRKVKSPVDALRECFDAQSAAAPRS